MATVPPCASTSSGVGTAALCPADRVDFVSADLGDGNDSITLSAAGIYRGVVSGGGGADRFFGGQGNDQLDGGAGDDRIDGWQGNDELIGGSGADTLIGGDGGDVMDARDGTRDEIECGAGSDRVRADVIDAVAADCEDVQHGGALPSALTVIAAELGRTSAKLVAVVNPGGSATTVHFEFGTDLRYGSRTESRPIGSGVDDVVVTIVASGLKPGTTYHFRAVATSSEGTSLGDDASFATAKAAGACVVPRLRGRSLVAARAMLIRSGCRLGSIRRIRAREKPGTVVGQRPRAGARLRTGARVSVIVSR